MKLWYWIRSLSFQIRNIEVPKWSALRRFGTNKYLNSSYFYLFIVPLLAKLTSNLNDNLQLKIFGETFALNLELPFSWIVFYFSALAFSLASLVYFVKVPKLISDHVDAKDFKNVGKGWQELWPYFNEFFGYSIRQEAFRSESRFVRLNHYLANDLNEESYDRIRSELNSANQEDSTVSSIAIKLIDLWRKEMGTNPEHLNSGFWILYEFYNDKGKSARLICSLLYLIGAVLIAVIIIQNLMYVFDYLFA